MELEGAVDDADSVGVVGATSLIGGCVLRLIAEQGQSVSAFSRCPPASPSTSRLNWHRLGVGGKDSHAETWVPIANWIYLAPIWTLPDRLPSLLAMGANRIVAISSTSRFSKTPESGSAEPAEHIVARRITEAEEFFQRWADERGLEWVILRPTLVYGYGRDKNISEIARFIYRFRCFPLLGGAQGLRQPIHAEDVAAAAAAALFSKNIKAKDFNIAGGEILTYIEMVSRVFFACKSSIRLVRIPELFFKIGLIFLALIPRYRSWNPSMAARMNEDLIFDSENANRQLGLSPRRFVLTELDLPKR